MPRGRRTGPGGGGRRGRGGRWRRRCGRGSPAPRSPTRRPAWPRGWARLPGPGPEAFLQKFGGSSLDWALRVGVRMDESPKVLSDLKRAVSEELEKEKIEVPFPQHDLHVRSVAPDAREALGGKERSPAS